MDTCMHSYWAGKPISGEKGEASQTLYDHFTETVISLLQACAINQSNGFLPIKKIIVIN